MHKNRDHTQLLFNQASAKITQAEVGFLLPNFCFRNSLVNRSETIKWQPVQWVVWVRSEEGENHGQQPTLGSEERILVGTCNGMLASAQDGKHLWCSWPTCSRDSKATTRWRTAAGVMQQLALSHKSTFPLGLGSNASISGKQHFRSRLGLVLVHTQGAVLVSGYHSHGDLWPNYIPLHSIFCRIAAITFRKRDLQFLQQALRRSSRAHAGHHVGTCWLAPSARTGSEEVKHQWA